jgi:hypothetical protein
MFATLQPDHDLHGELLFDYLSIHLTTTLHLGLALILSFFTPFSLYE